MSDSILFLDLATITGWCEGAPRQKPTSGRLRLGRVGASDAEVLGTMLGWLADRLTEQRYSRVVYEAPVGPGKKGKTTFQTQRRLLNLCGVVEAVSFQTGHPVYQASVQSIRKMVIGDGRPEDPKAAVIAAMKREGFAPADDNEADAICGWIYATRMQDRIDPPLLRKVRARR